MIVERQVNQLDRNCLEQLYCGVGSLAYDPVVLFKMVLYQYLKGRRSPATWFQEAKLNEAMQWLGRGYVPARRTWYEFRNRVGGALEDIHQQIISNAIDQDLLDPDVSVQDGTSVAACASRHKMVNRQTLDRRMELLEKLMNGSHPPSEPIPSWVPPTCCGRHNLADRMQISSGVLDERIAKNATKQSGQRKDPSKIQVSLTDPMAPLGRDKMKVFRPMYTVQYAIEPSSRIIMGYRCDAAVTDTGTLIPMINTLQTIGGGRLKTMMADAAYCSILDLRDCAERGVELLAPVQENSFTKQKQAKKTDQQIPRSEFRFDAEQNSYECPAGHELRYCGRERKQRQGDRSLWQSRYRCDAELCQSCPLAAKCLRPSSTSRTIKRLEGQELLDAQREKMNRPDVRTRYALRGQTVELGFADAKEHRGLKRFHGRGPERAQAETGLLVVAQNLMRLDRLQRDGTNPHKLTT